MKKAAIVLMTAMAVTACATSSPPPPGPPPPPPPMMQRDTVTPARDMCEVDTLAGQRLDMLAEIHGYRETIGVRTSERSGVADTETQELIAAFETDLDASYRFATASCRTYNRCLEENRFEESQCQDSAALWHDGQDRFHDLSERLAMVRERIASDCNDCRSSATQTEPRRRHEHDDEGDGSLMGSVFSTGPN